jgi:hypothetical protein
VRGRQCGRPPKSAPRPGDARRRACPPVGKNDTGTPARSRTRAPRFDGPRVLSHITGSVRHWRRVWLTDLVPRGTPLDPEQQRRQRQYIAFAWVAAVLILILAWMQIQHGTVRAVGLIIGLPIIAILLILAVRWSRAIKRP